MYSTCGSVGSLVKSRRKSTKNRKSKRQDIPPELLIVSSKEIFDGRTNKELFIGHEPQEPKMGQKILVKYVLRPPLRSMVIGCCQQICMQSVIYYGRTKRLMNNTQCRGEEDRCVGQEPTINKRKFVISYRASIKGLKRLKRARLTTLKRPQSKYTDGSSSSSSSTNVYGRWKDQYHLSTVVVVVVYYPHSPSNDVFVV